MANFLDATYVIRTSTPAKTGETSCILASLGNGNYILETATVRVDDAFANPAIIVAEYTDAEGTTTYQTLESGWCMTGTYHQLELRRAIRLTGPVKVVTYCYRAVSGTHIGSCSYRRVLD